MADPTPHTVPRWLHVWAILTVAATLLLLLVGQFVTSFSAGMADPVWPTEPWYITHTATPDEKEKYQKDFAFFIEHTHRITAWTVGGLVIVLAGGLLWTDPRKTARWVVIAGLIVLVAGFGLFHSGMRAQQEMLAAEVKLPMYSVYITVSGFAVMLAGVASGLLSGTRGTILRILGALSLAAVMIQGLLGGFRVRFNELAGTDLAAYHGIFAQVVLGLLIAIAVLTARPRRSSYGDSPPKLGRWAVLLTLVMFMQVIFGAWLRHFPDPLAQRLHLLTAFAATVGVVWLLIAVSADIAGRMKAGWLTWAVALLLAIQLYLGVEAWLARFGQYTLPELVKLTPEGGAIRSFHAFIGSGLWGATLALALRLRRTNTEQIATSNLSRDAMWSGSPSHAAAIAPAETRK